MSRLLADGFVSVAGASEYLAISPTRIYQLIRGGVLSHAVLGGKIVVPRRALMDYAKERLQIGSIA